MLQTRTQYEQELETAHSDVHKAEIVCWPFEEKGNHVGLSIRRLDEKQADHNQNKQEVDGYDDHRIEKAKSRGVPVCVRVTKGTSP